MKKGAPELSLLNVLSALISDRSNLDLKTEIHKPKEFSIFELYGKNFKYEGYPETSELIGEFCELYRSNMVSFNRGSRKEVRDILKSWIEKYETDKEGNLLITSNNK